MTEHEHQTLVEIAAALDGLQHRLSAIAGDLGALRERVAA